MSNRTEGRQTDLGRRAAWGRHLLGLLGGEAVKDLVETVLALPGVCDDGGVLVFLASSEGRPHGGPLSIVPGGLHEDVANAGIAGLGDGAEAPSVSGGVLTGDEAQIGHELSGTLEAAQVAEFGGDDHGRLGLEPSETAKPIDDGLVARVPIPLKWPTHSAGSGPGIPKEVAHPFQDKRPGHRSEATLAA